MSDALSDHLRSILDKHAPHGWNVNVVCNGTYIRTMATVYTHTQLDETVWAELRSLVPWCMFEFTTYNANPEIHKGR